MALQAHPPYLRSENRNRFADDADGADATSFITSISRFALRHQLFQPPIFHLELPQALDIARLQTTEALAPGVDRLLADVLPLGHRRPRIAIRLSDDRHHLLFRKSSFPHCSLRIGSQSLNLSMVRKSAGRSSAPR